MTNSPVTGRSLRQCRERATKWSGKQFLAETWHLRCLAILIFLGQPSSNVAVFFTAGKVGGPHQSGSAYDLMISDRLQLDPACCTLFNAIDLKHIEGTLEIQLGEEPK